jgi:hypothetical protein
MKIEYQLTKIDYIKSSFEIITKYFLYNFIYLTLLSIIISYSINYKKLDIYNFVYTAILSFIFITFLLFIKNIFYLLKLYFQKETDLIFNKKISFEVNEKGVKINESTIVLEWHSIKKLDILKNFIYLIFDNNKPFIIKKDDFSIDELNDFIKKYKQYKENNSFKLKDKINPNNFILLGLFGFIPNIGILIGIYLIYLGIKLDLRKFLFIGIINILFTPLFWFLYNKSSINENSNIEITKFQLNEIVKDIEYYKLKNGKYPDNLSILRNQTKYFNDIDVFSLEGGKTSSFFYKKLDEKFILKSIGPDKKLNTKDDIFPDLK